MPNLRYLTKTYSLSTYLVLIVLIAVFPVLFFTGFMVNNLVQAKRDASEKVLIKAAEQIALAFDQEVQSSMRTLQALTVSESLRRRDLKTFHSELVRVLETQTSWASIVLHNEKSEWLLSARKPYGTKLGPVPEPESLRGVIETGKPRVGRIIRIPSGNQIPSNFGFAVRVPIKGNDGAVIYVLSAILSTKPLQDLVNRLELAPQEWVRALLDQVGFLAARSRESEKFVGGPASESLLKHLKKKDSGFDYTVTLENVPAYSAYKRAPFSGWYAAVAVPAEILQSESQATQSQIVLIGFFVISISTAVTFLLSHWIKKSIKAGSDNAAYLARGETPQMKPSRIREMEQLRASLISASGLLRSRDRAKSEFLANMSHELRTPLGIVLGMTEVISKEASSDEHTKSWEIIKRNGQQLLRLIDDILDFSKIEANRLVIENIEFSLPDLISSIVEDFSNQALEKGIRLKVKFEEGAPNIVNSDVLRVRQVLYNLVANAVKFTPKGQVEIAVGQQQEKTVKIQIRDTGIGLTDEQQSVLFTNFTQGDSSHTRKYGGTGLGLSLSRKLARLLGGDVHLIKSHPDEGSTFEFVFASNSNNKVLKTTPDLPLVSQPVAAQELKIDFLKGRQILLAEDSPDNVTLIQAYLKPLGVQMTLASNGLEAVNLMRQKKFDLILMDLQMPEMDGFEATRLIREFNLQIPIVALTAHALAEHRTRALESGFTDYLTKPIRRQQLVQALERHLH